MPSAQWCMGCSAPNRNIASPDSIVHTESVSGCNGYGGCATISVKPSAVVPMAPHLAAETNIYIDTQLKAFRLGKRTNEVMGPIAQDLTDAEIRAAADWYADVGLTITQVD